MSTRTIKIFGERSLVNSGTFCACISERGRITSKFSFVQRRQFLKKIECVFVPPPIVTI